MRIDHSPTWQRLRTDFRFAVVILFAAVAVLGILPFAGYRFATGNPVAGSVDAGIVLCLLECIVYAWRGGDLERVGLLMVAGCTAGCVAIAMLTGLPGLLWSYPVLLANYLLVSRRSALLVSLVAVGCIALLGRGVSASPLLLVTFITTASVVSAFAYIFAHRTGRQRAQLQTLATRDPLTGAGNRRAMDSGLALAIEARRRHDARFALVLLDLDEFKRINDRYGHEAGDSVLVDFARLLHRHFRKLDRVYRLGGEEFVVLMSGAEAGTLEVVCESIRVRVERELRYRDERVTVSIGAAVLGSDDVLQWLSRADAAMYRAKRLGRNRVEIDPDASVPVDDGSAPAGRQP